MFTVVVDLIGLIAFSTFVSGITATMTQLRQSREAHSASMGAVTEFFLQNAVSIPVSCRVMTYLRFNTGVDMMQRTTTDCVKALRSLPTELREALTIDVNQRILVAHPFFRALHSEDSPVLSKIALSNLQEKPLSPGEMFFRKFEEGKYMWFIIFGEMSYHRDSMKQLLPSKSWLSEASLWIEGWRHRGDLLSVKQSNLVGLHTSSFSKIVEQLLPGEKIAVLTKSYAIRFISVFKELDPSSPFSCTDIWTDVNGAVELLRSAAPARARP